MISVKGIFSKITAAALICTLTLPLFASCTKIEDRQEDDTMNETTQNATSGGQGDSQVTPAATEILVVTPKDKPVYYDQLIASLGGVEGTTVKQIDWNGAEEAVKSSKGVVILPDAATVPYGMSDAVDTYLKKGGRLVTLGGPPLTQTMYESDAGWKSKSELIKEAAGGEGGQLLFDFEKVADGKNWSRGTSNDKGKLTVETGDYGSPDGNALHVGIADMTGWDTVSKKMSIGAEYNSIGMYVKGAEQTTSLCLEIREKDGSRWFATFAVGTEWQYVVLPEREFVYWHDSSSKDRGGEGDSLNLANADLFCIGLALSHTAVSTGAHEYWVDSVYAMDFELLTQPLPVIDGLSPEYKFYPVTNAAKCVTFDNQVFVTERGYTLPSADGLFSLSPRPQGTGFGKGKNVRFVPLIELYDENDLRSGFLAWMFVYSSGNGADSTPYEGSIIAGFGTSDAAFYNADGISAVTEVVRSMAVGAMLAEGGSDEYLYIDSETKEIKVGGVIRKNNSEGLTLEIALSSGGNILTEFNDSKLLPESYRTRNYASPFTYPITDTKPDYVSVTLKKDGKIVDRIAHAITFWSPKPESERKYFTAENNEFMRDGKPVRLYGVNFMPTSGIGVNIENGSYFEHYVSSISYDPDNFYKDLLRVKEVGFNAVSLFVYYETITSTTNMLHLINMCEEMGLYVDLSLRPHADPFSFDENQVKEMIQISHLNELDNIVAYDIAWERYFGTYDGSYGNPLGRKEYDYEWQKWIDANYGSFDNAKVQWGYDAAGIAVTDDMLRNDGAYRKMVAAYRRFVDDLVADKHLYAVNTIHSVDPHHLISARTGSQGGVPMADPGDMGYDFMALARALDFMSPESYVFNSDVKQANQGIFTNVYSRYVKTGAPVVWKEFGQHIWGGSNFNSSEKPQQVQADYYRHLYEMALAGHTGAMYCWWWAGGYRTNENSDYGVVNPDGSDRLVTKVIREYRDKFLNQPMLPEPDIYFEIDRDEYVDGIRGIYLEIKDEFLAAVESGKTVAFKDAAK